jgi:hypothetical protein
MGPHGIVLGATIMSISLVPDYHDFGLRQEPVFDSLHNLLVYYPVLHIEGLTAA